MVLQFDATHRPFELTMSWGRLVAGVFLCRAALGRHLLLGFPACFTLFSQFLPFSVGVVFLSGSL
jgi:hypothetical protein